MSSDILRIAHRGASGDGLAPENTIAAIRLALEIGVDAVEMDVRRTRDGALILMHDHSVSRTTDGRGDVVDLTLEEIKRLDAGTWKDGKFAGERVPTLEEALLELKGKAMPVIEAKVGDIARDLFGVLVEHDMILEAIVISFNWDLLRDLRAISDMVRTGALLGADDLLKGRRDSRGAVDEIARELGGTAVFHHSLLTPKVVDRLRERAIQIFAWTVDSPEKMKEMIRLGVNGIITNYPDRLNKVLRELREEHLKG